MPPARWIGAFLRAVASGLRGDGFTDAALVMEWIASGKVGGRGPGRKPQNAAFDRTPVASLTGDKLGEWADIRQLGRKSQAWWYRDNLIGMEVVNADTGWTIGFQTRGAKKIGGRKSEDLYRIAPAIKAILEKGTLIRTEQDGLLPVSWTRR